LRELSYRELSDRYRELLDAADDVKKEAYNPYSRFYVGAAILTRDGMIVTGTNVENSAYGSTICAERMALGRANSMGQRHFEAIAIIGTGEGAANGQITGPCGACRQMLFEFSCISEKPMDVIMADGGKERVVIATIAELLPLAFGPGGLGIDVSEYRT